MGVSGAIDLTNPSVIPNSIVNDPGGDGGTYFYTVDLTSGATFTLTGDFESTNGEAESNYLEVFGPGRPGSFSINSDGTFTYTVTLAEVQFAATSMGTINIQGEDVLGGVDTDTISFSYIICFAKGTGIATPFGEVPVETLAIGDNVRTADGRDVPVKWVGRVETNPMFKPADRLAPVRIHADALGSNRPDKDLVVTADHGMVLDGMIINASALVNGDSIIWDDWKRYGESLTYYHVETEEHDVILAHGAASETFLDMPDRQSFDNFDEYVALYGEETKIGEAAMPRITSARLVPDHIKARLATKTAA